MSPLKGRPTKLQSELKLPIYRCVTSPLKGRPQGVFAVTNSAAHKAFCRNVCFIGTNVAMGTASL
jgi:hypothetical protein